MNMVNHRYSYMIWRLHYIANCLKWHEVVKKFKNKKIKLLILLQDVSNAGLHLSAVLHVPPKQTPIGSLFDQKKKKKKKKKKK